MDKERYFIQLFNRLEQYLRITYSNSDYSYTGFITRLYQIKKSKENHIINDNQSFEVIKKAAQMRNIIAHNNDVLVPSDRFVKNFAEVVERITKPLTVKDVMTDYYDLKTASLTSTINEVMELLISSGFSTIPIVENDELAGIFTEKSVFDYLALNENSHVDKNMTMNEIIEAINLNNHPRKYYDFVSVDTDIYQAYKLFNQDKRTRREMLLLLVTKNGNSDEHLLGIVALRDLEKQLIN